MCAVGSEPYIINKVACRHDAKTGVENLVSPIDGFKVFFSALAVVGEHFEHAVAQVSLTGDGFYLCECLRFVHESIVRLPPLGDTSPRCPSPDALKGGEKVILLYVSCHLVGVESADHVDTLVVFVAVKHLFAEREERL